MSGLGRISGEPVPSPFAANGGFSPNGGFGLYGGAGPQPKGAPASPLGAAQTTPMPNVGTGPAGGPPGVPQSMPTPPGYQSAGPTSPTVPHSGQVAYAQQSSPNWGAASTGATLAWAGKGGYNYALDSSGNIKIIAAPTGKPTGTIVTVASNRAAYTAILSEFLSMYANHPQKSLAAAWLAHAQGQAAVPVSPVASTIAALTSLVPGAGATFQPGGGASTAIPVTLTPEEPTMLQRVAAIPGKIPWWGWLLIGTAALGTVAGGGYLVVSRRRNGKRRRRNGKGPLAALWAFLFGGDSVEDDAADVASWATTDADAAEAEGSLAVDDVDDMDGE